MNFPIPLHLLSVVMVSTVLCYDLTHTALSTELILVLRPDPYCILSQNWGTFELNTLSFTVDMTVSTILPLSTSSLRSFITLPYH